MHKGALLFGLTALAVGAFVAFAPIFPVPSGSQEIGDGQIAYFQVHSLGLDQVIQVSWTAHAPTKVWALDCGSTQPRPAIVDPCPQNRTVGSATAGSGTLTFGAANDDWILVESQNFVNITMRTTNGLIGVPVMGFGALLLVIAVVVRPKASGPRSASPRAKVSAATEEASTPETTGAASPPAARTPGKEQEDYREDEEGATETSPEESLDESGEEAAVPFARDGAPTA